MNNPETDPKPENEPQLEAGGDCPSASCSASLVVCKDEKTMQGVMDRLQPYQAAILAGSTRKPYFTADQADYKYQAIHWKHMAKMAKESLEAWAGKKLPTWKHIGELGEIAYMEDGAIRWKVWAGYEDMRLFLVYLASGEVETHFAYIDETGMLCNEHGDDVGWAWYDAEYFMDIPERPSLPNREI